MTLIRQATTEDAQTIRQLAEKIWWPTYSPILSPEQLRYMLDSFYSLDVITRQINTNEQTYLLLFAGDAPVGFAAFSPRAENPEVYKLHKIYCLVETKGLGYGKTLIEEVERRVLTTGKHILELNVNRHNPALGFYTHLGFSIVYEEDIDIGHGYFMNDYVMRKEL